MHPDAVASRSPERAEASGAESGCAVAAASGRPRSGGVPTPAGLLLLALAAVMGGRRRNRGGRARGSR